MDPTRLLAGRCGLVVGIANERSIAYGIGRAAAAAGAELAVTYQDARLRPRVGALAAALGNPLMLPWEAGDDAQLEAAMAACAARFGRLDFIVHSIAAARREELCGSFVQTSREGFAHALEVSAYSLVALTRAALPLLQRGREPAVLTLTYEASRRAVPNYNVMGVAKAALEASVRYLAQDLGPHGIRVNALSAGPLRTLSAAGVGGLRDMLAHVEASAPLRRNVALDEVGAAALFALGPLGRAMTGEVFHVDCGMHLLGSAPSAPAAAAGAA